MSEEKKTKECPYCGEEILATAKKCKHCGAWLEEHKENPLLSDEEIDQIAEDAVHDAFLSFARHFKKFEKTDHDRIRSYLMITVRNAAFKIYNRHGKEISTEDVYFDSGQIADISTDIENHELEFRLFQMIKNLDRKYGDVIILKYYCGMRDREIADSLGISRDNVKIRLYRARNILKQKLKEAGF